MTERPELAKLLEEIARDERIAVRKVTQMSQAEICLLVKDRKSHDPKPDEHKRLP